MWLYGVHARSNLWLSLGDVRCILMLIIVSRLQATTHHRHIPLGLWPTRKCDILITQYILIQMVRNVAPLLGPHMAIGSLVLGKNLHLLLCEVLRILNKSIHLVASIALGLSEFSIDCGYFWLCASSDHCDLSRLLVSNLCELDRALLSLAVANFLDPTILAHAHMRLFTSDLSQHGFDVCKPVIHLHQLDPVGCRQRLIHVLRCQQLDGLLEIRLWFLHESSMGVVDVYRLLTLSTRLLINVLLPPRIIGRKLLQLRRNTHV